MTELILRGRDGGGAGMAVGALVWRRQARGLGAVLGEIPAAERGYDGSHFARV